MLIGRSSQSEIMGGEEYLSPVFVNPSSFCCHRFVTLIVLYPLVYNLFNNFEVLGHWGSLAGGSYWITARTLVAVTVTLPAVQRQERAPGHPLFLDPPEA